MTESKDMFADRNVLAQRRVHNAPMEETEKKALLETIRMGCDVITEAYEVAQWFQSPDTEFHLKVALGNANEALKAFQRDFATAGKKERPTIGHIELPPIKKGGVECSRAGIGNGEK